MRVEKMSYRIVGPTRLREVEAPYVKASRHRFKAVVQQMHSQLNEFVLPDYVSDIEELGSDKFIGLSRSGATPKRRSSLIIEEPKRQNYVMKLFDRSVDLAGFTEDIPLYPISRAWLKGNSSKLKTQKGRGQTNEEEDEQTETAFNGDSGGDAIVTELPLPEPMPYDGFGNPVSLRVPPPLAPTYEPFSISSGCNADQFAPSPAVLFQNHLDRWNLIRHRWKEAAAFNERRYHASLKIIETTATAH